MASSVIGNLQIMVGADLSELESDLARIPTLLAEVGSSAGNIGGDAFAGLDTSIKEVGGDAEQTKGNLQDLGKGAQEAGGEAGGAAEMFEGLKEGLTELAGELGIVFSAYEILKTSLEDFAEIEKATIALTALTGSAETAETMITSLRELAQSGGLDFPQLVAAAQRMAALGFEASQIPGILGTVADAAAATGRDIDSVANSFDRMALSGAAGGRQLSTLGLTLSDLADALGTTQDQAAKAFKALDESSRINVLTSALAQYAGVAQQTGEGLAGEWQKTKNSLTEAFEAIGAALAPLSKQILEFTQDAAKETADFVADVTAAAGAYVDQMKKVSDANATARSGFGAGAGPSPTESLDETKKAADSATLSLTNMNAQMLANLKQQQGGEGVKIPTPYLVQNAPTADFTAWNEQQTLLTDSVEILNAADNQHASDLRSLYVPAITDVASAEKELGIERLGLQGSDQALVDAEAALRAARDSGSASTQQLKLLEDNVILARATAKEAAADYSEAEKNLQASKSADASLTKDLQSAEDALASAEKSTHIPALLDHKTALDNIATAQDNYELAVTAVKVAEADAQAVQKDSVKTADDVKTASDNLAAAKNNLKTAVTALKVATDDEKTSLSLVGAAQKELASDEEAAIASKKTLGSGIVDLNTSLGDYRDALQRAKDANDTLGDAEISLQSLLDSGTASAKDLKEATDAAKLARQQATTADKDATSQLQALTNQFGLSKDAVLLLNQAQSDGVTDTQTLQAAFRLLGEQSTDSLNALATAADQAYKDILDSGTASSTQLRIAQINDLMAVQNAKAAQGQALTTDEALTLATLKQEQADYQANTIQGWATMYSTIDADVKTTAASMIKTLFEGGGSFHDEAIRGLQEIGEAVVTKFTKPFTDAIASLIAGGIARLLGSTGLGGISDALANITKSFGGLSSSFSSGLDGIGAGIGKAGTGAIGDLASNGDTIAGIGQAAGGGGGAAGLAGLGLSSITGIASVVGAVAQIGSGITAGLQAATTNDHLFHIMSDTAYIKAYTGYTAESTRNTDTDLQELMTFNWGTLHLDLINIGSGVIDGLIPRIDQVNASLMRMFDLELLQTAFAAKTAGYGSLNVTLTNTDPKAVAQSIAHLLGLSAPSFA